MNNQTIYGIISDRGDGSSSVLWFRNVNTVCELLHNNHPNSDEFWRNEGLINQVLTFPQELDLEYCGFYFSDVDFENQFC
jgi:hypothetical protein